MKEYIRALALLIGTQIGAGVLGLPYAIKTLGFFWGSLSIVLAGLMMGLTAVYLVEALFRTNKNYHLFELFEHHFGKRGSIIFTIVLLLSVYGALAAYTYGMASSINNLTDLEITIAGILLWLLLSLVVLKGLRLSTTVEWSMVTLMGLLFILTVVWLLPYIKPYHIPLEERYKELFTAFSVAVFAFYMHLVIPETIRLLKTKDRVINAIRDAFIVTTALYVIFSLSVIGVLGENTPEIAVFGLVEVLGEYYKPLAYVIPLLTMLTSFVGVSLGAVDMLQELIRRRYWAWILVVVPPLLMFLMNMKFYNSLLFGSLGLILAGGILPSLLMIKIQHKPHPLPYITLLLFVLVLTGELLPI